MNTESALQGGLTGAATLTILHEIVRKFSPDAPRMDELGMQALSKLFKKLHLEVPDKDQLYLLSTGAELLSNGLYYAIAGAGSKDNVYLRGALLGATAGIGAITLPGVMGLDDSASNRTPKTKVMTVAWYLLGGIVASAVTEKLQQRLERKHK